MGGGKHEMWHVIEAFDPRDAVIADAPHHPLEVGD